MSSLMTDEEVRQSDIAKYNIDQPVAERVKIAQKKFDDAIEEEQAILKEHLRLKSIFEEGLQLAQPVLSAHETLVMPLVDQLVAKHAKIVGIMKKPRKELLDRIHKHSDNRLQVSYYYNHLKRSQDMDMDPHDRVICIMRSEEWLDDSKELLSFDELMDRRDDLNGSRDQILLQVQIEKMLEQQPQGIKDYVLVHKNRFAERIEKFTTKPVVELGQRKQRLNAGLHIPLEIATMIYSHADLESCVSLRQVSTSWYGAYQHSEKYLRTKVRSRMPWMKPEDEINTWGLCALVFISRLRSKKWSTVNCLNKLYARRKATPVEQLVAVELKPYEKLSEEIMGLRTDESLSVGGKDLDLWKLETVNRFERFKYLDSNDKEYKILYKGITITLPNEAVIDTYPPESSYFKLPYPITVNRLYITVRCEGYSYLMPRSHPHYRYANKHYKNTGSFEINNVAGVKIGNPGIECSKQDYRFLDPQTRRLREYMPRCRAAPKACYNGLFWWVEKKRNVIPTFIDLQNPGVMYYRKDKIITVDDGSENLTGVMRAVRAEEKGAFEQSAEAGNTRFMTKQSDRGLLIIDLNSGKVTECVDPNDTGKGERSVFIPGFLQGKYTQNFSVKYVSHKTSEVYRKDAGLLEKFVEAKGCGKCGKCGC